MEINPKIYIQKHIYHMLEVGLMQWTNERGIIKM
jgi:hypothetical protein